MIIFRDINVALREIEVNGKKLQLIYEGDSLTDCVDERSIDKDICYEDDNIWTDDIEEKFKVIEETVPPREIEWIESYDDLHRRCHLVKTQARSQVLRQHIKHRYTSVIIMIFVN